MVFHLEVVLLLGASAYLELVTGLVGRKACDICIHRVSVVLRSMEAALALGPLA